MLIANKMKRLALALSLGLYLGTIAVADVTPVFAAANASVGDSGSTAAAGGTDWMPNVNKNTGTNLPVISQYRPKVTPTPTPPTPSPSPSPAPTPSPASTDPYKGVEIVAYEGLFTSPLIEKNVCSKTEGQPLLGSPGDPGAGESSGKIASLLKDLLTGFVNSITNVFFHYQCPGDDGHPLSIIPHIMNITAPMNLTQNYIIMKLISMTQAIAFVFAIGLVVFYGIMYTTGYENLDPVKFGVRMFFALLSVYYLPYLMQDVLNLNNVIIHYFSMINVQFDGTAGDAPTAFGHALSDFATNIGGDGSSLLNGLLTLIIVLIMFYFALTPIIKILVWWYLRLLRILFYAVIGPLIIVMLGLPATAGMATKWIKNFIGETFSQFFMVLGMTMMAFILGNMNDFGALTNLDWIGKLMIIYASILFLGDVPKYASEFIGGISGGTPNELATGVMRMAKTANRASKPIQQKAGQAAVMGAKGVDRATGNRVSDYSKAVSGAAKDKVGSIKAGMAATRETRRSRNNAEIDKASSSVSRNNKSLTATRQGDRANTDMSRSQTEGHKENRERQLDTRIMTNPKDKKMTKDQKETRAKRNKEIATALHPDHHGDAGHLPLKHNQANVKNDKVKNAVKKMHDTTPTQHTRNLEKINQTPNSPRHLNKEEIQRRKNDPEYRKQQQKNQTNANGINRTPPPNNGGNKK